MLPLKYRLKKKRDIERVFKKGRTIKDSFFILRTVEGKENFYRFAFIVPKKVSNKANVRNKIKRVAREAVKERIKEPFPLSDNIIIALPGAEKEDSASIKELIEKLLKKSF